MTPPLPRSGRLVGLLFLLLPALAGAQGADSLYTGGIRMNLNKDNTKFLRIITWHQVWLRHLQYNPGTVINGEEVSQSWNLGLRRSRILFWAQISPRFLIISHFGINNQTVTRGGVGVSGYPNATSDAATPKKPQLFLHDAWTEYAVVPGKLHIGTGLHYWNGVSRQASASTLNFLALDAPILNWAEIEATDQFARMFGIYAKGYLGKLDYRVALNQPFAFADISGGSANAAIGGAVNPNAASPYVETRYIQNNNWATQGYLAYNFLDKESNALPFYVGTYVGTKKVFNLGAGWFYHPQSMGRRQVLANGTGGPLEKFDTKLFGVDAFLDYPFKGRNNLAVTGYLAYYHYDFGPNYVRNVGIMNPATGGATNNDIAAQPTSFNGAGNAFPTIGTGDWLYFEGGFLLPKPWLEKKVRIQPIVSMIYGNVDRLQDPVSVPAVGANFYIAGHHAKITFLLRDHPVFDVRRDGAGNVEQNTGLVPNLSVPNLYQSGRRTELIIQSQIYL